MLELLIVMVVAVPILGSVMATSSMVSREVSTSDATSSAGEVCREMNQSMTKLLRAGVLSSCRIRATEEDVEEAKAANAINPSIPIPALGEWISPPPGRPRPTFRFQAADGVMAMNASALTPVRSFEFLLDGSEADNDADDDGDGMIDEGRLFLREGARLLQVATGIEVCSFLLDGRTLTVAMQAARRSGAGRVHRCNSSQRIFLRNN